MKKNNKKKSKKDKMYLFVIDNSGKKAKINIFEGSAEDLYSLARSYSRGKADVYLARKKFDTKARIRWRHFESKKHRNCINWEN